MPRLRLHGCLYHPVKPTNDNSKQALAVTGPPKLQDLGGFLSNVIGQVQVIFFDAKICVCQKKAVPLHRTISKAGQTRSNVPLPEQV